MALANSILSQAVNSMCSEVHFEPMNGGLILRFMQGGDLMDETTLPAELTSMLILCLKTIGGLDTSVVDKPQDQRIATSSFGSEVQLRMTSIPGEFGEMVAISLQ
jgi:Type II secretory pathway, ATPase PulE/Tfp pilus assembly pathway, ATPase PilB